MSRRSRSPHAPAPRPHFLWQGTLIILPALVLAAAGFSALRQDRALAEHEAREQAKRIAAELVQTVLPRALVGESMEAVRPEQAATPVPSPGDDLILRAARSLPRRVLFATDAMGALIWPAPVAPLPAPQPLDLNELNPDQANRWQALEQSLAAEQTSAKRNVREALRSFLDSKPSARFAALALFRSASAHRALWDTDEAAALFLQVRDKHGDVVGETGLRLRDLAELELAILVPSAHRAQLLHDLASRVLSEPTELSHVFLSRAAEIEPTTREWLEVLSAHDAARALCHARPGAQRPEETTITFRDKEWLLFDESASGGVWTRAITLGDATHAVREALARHGLPAHFGVSVSLGRHTLHPVEMEKDALASWEEPFAGVRGSPRLAAKVSLIDPPRFYARQAARTRRFGAMIAAAGVAVLIGFFTARQAFRRQQALSEMKTNFVSSVSHELRAPIASVRLMAEELESGRGASPEKARQYHRFIAGECRRLSAVIENVLDFSRREQGREQWDFEPTAIDALVADTVGVMRAYAAEREVQVETIIVGRVRPVDADGRALGRLLVNLIDNAIKHSPPKACVRVGAEFSADHLYLWVEDDGPGIPCEEHARIFERFYRVGSELRRETAGVGLGLSIVKRVAEVHGGRVLVRSEVGKGSRFTVELPMRSAVESTLEEAAAIS